MQLILSNPYRIIGVLPDISLKEFTKHVRKITKYLDTENDIPEGYSFKLLGPLTRDYKSISDSESKLKLDSDKVISILFWFYNGNPIYDEPALDLVTNGDLKGATEIWLKLISKGEINAKNWSAFHNLSILCLCNAFGKNAINRNLFEQGVSLKLKFIDSIHFEKIFYQALDKSYEINKDLIRDIFLEQVYEELEIYDDDYIINYLEILIKNKISQTDISFKRFLDKYINIIDKKIKQVNYNLNSDGKAILEKTRLLMSFADNIVLLKSIIGYNIVSLNSSSDRLADILNRISVKVFNEYYNLENDYIEEVISLANNAKSIADGNVINEKIDNNLKVFLEYKETKENKEKEKRVNSHLKIINILIDEFNKSEKSVINLNNLIISCNTYISDMRSVLGCEDVIYANTCNLFVNLVIETVVDLISSNTNTGTYFVNNAPYEDIIQLKSNLKKSWFALANIQFLYMTEDQRIKYNNMKETISFNLINILNRNYHTETK